MSINKYVHAPASTDTNNSYRCLQICRLHQLVTNQNSFVVLADAAGQVLPQCETDTMHDVSLPRVSSKKANITHDLNNRILTNILPVTLHSRDAR